MKYFIIGAGGVGGWLAQWAAKTAKAGDSLHLQDGDVVEAHNLDRQLFGVRDVGKSKAAAVGWSLHKTLPPEIPLYAHPTYFKPGDRLPICDDPLLVILGVDNNTARIAAFNAVMEAYRAGQKVLLVAGSNEKQAADGWAWHPAVFPSNCDPRSLMPELFVDDGGHSPATSCIAQQAAAKKGTPQTASANFIGASLAVALCEFYTTVFPFWELLLPEDPVVPTLPVRHQWAMSLIRTTKVKEVPQ